MRSFASILMIGFIVLSCGSGCATVVRGLSQKVKFHTEPPGATVNVNGADHNAPVEVPLRRNKMHTVIVSAPGYQSIAFDLEAKWDGVSLGNIVMPGGSVGFGVDTVSGADRSFGDLAVIKLNKAAGTSTMPVTMYFHRGKVMTKDERDKAVAEEKEYRSRPPD